MRSVKGNVNAGCIKEPVPALTTYQHDNDGLFPDPTVTRSNDTEDPLPSNTQEFASTKKSPELSLNCDGKHLRKPTTLYTSLKAGLNAIQARRIQDGDQSRGLKLASGSTLNAIGSARKTQRVIPSEEIRRKCKEVFHSKEIVSNKKKVSNNIYLRIQSLNKNLLESKIDFEIDFKDHLIKFYYYDEFNEKKLLCGQELQPDEQDFLQDINHENHDSCITLSQLYANIQKKLNSKFAVIPKGADPGIELYSVGDHDWVIKKNHEGDVLEIMALPDCDIYRPGGYSKFVARVNWYSGTMEMRRTPGAIAYNTARLNRRPSLTPIEIAQIASETIANGIVPVHLLGVDVDGHESWVSQLCSVLKYTTDIHLFEQAAITLKLLHDKHGAHCDIKSTNLLLGLVSKTFDDERPLMRDSCYKSKVVSNSEYLQNPENFGNLDIILRISNENAPILMIKDVDGKYIEITAKEYSFNPLLDSSLKAIVAEKCATEVEDMLRDIVWRYKRFFVTRGLSPNEEFMVQFIDFWRAVKPRDINNETLSLRERVDLAVQSVGECFNAITPTHMVQDLYSRFIVLKQEIKTRYSSFNDSTSDVDLGEVLDLSFQALRIGYYADNFAFLLTLLETQRYNLHNTFAILNPKENGIPKGLPFYEMESVEARDYCKKYSIPLDDYKKNLLTLKKFIESYAVKANVIQLILSDPVSLYSIKEERSKLLPEYFVIPKMSKDEYIKQTENFKKTNLVFFDEESLKFYYIDNKSRIIPLEFASDIEIADKNQLISDVKSNKQINKNLLIRSFGYFSMPKVHDLINWSGKNHG